MKKETTNNKPKLSKNQSFVDAGPAVNKSGIGHAKGNAAGKKKETAKNKPNLSKNSGYIPTGPGV